MTLRLRVRRQGVDIDLDGLDALLSLHRHLHLDVDHITGVRVARQADLRVRSELGWRVGGGYWPGKLATGHYTVPGRKGARQFWCVYSAPEVLVIETDLDRPARVVLQVPEPHRSAALIDEARHNTH